VRGPISYRQSSSWSEKPEISYLHDPIGYLAHKLWRIIFFPIAMLALLIMGGMKGLVTFAGFALIVMALRMVIIP